MNRSKKFAFVFALALSLCAVSGCSNRTIEPPLDSDLSVDLSQPQTTSTESTSVTAASVQEFDCAPIIGEYDPNGAYDEIIKQKEAELLLASKDAVPETDEPVYDSVIDRVRAEYGVTVPMISAAEVFDIEKLDIPAPNGRRIVPIRFIDNETLLTAEYEDEALVDYGFYNLGKMSPAS